MSSFSNIQLEKKLKVLTMSQQSIQTLSLWCIHNRKHTKQVVQTWYKDIQKAKPKKKLILMYLANDVLQNSRRKGTEYVKEFLVVMPTTLSQCAQQCDEKIVDALKRIVSIWLERNVFAEAVISRFHAILGQSTFSEESRTTPPRESIPSEESQMNFTVSEYKRPAHAPDPDELVKRLHDLENSATQDAVVREKIANLPTEVTDPTYMDKVENLSSARKLHEKITEACTLLAKYNARLALEQKDRQIAQKMLQDYTACQRYQQALNEEKLGEYQSKLAKVTAVKKELQSHLENLPDMSKLPEPVPLPSAGDLFSSGGRLKVE